MQAHKLCRRLKNSHFRSLSPGWSIFIGLHLFTSCKGIQDRLGFWIPRCGFQIPGTGFQSLSVELGFWIPIVSEIPDSMSCIPDSKTRDSGFHKQNFPGFRMNLFEQNGMKANPEKHQTLVRGNTNPHMNIKYMRTETDFQS